MAFVTFLALTGWCIAVACVFGLVKLDRNLRQLQTSILHLRIDVEGLFDSVQDLECTDDILYEKLKLMVDS